MSSNLVFKEYEHYFSLGCSCSIATDLRTMGLRDHSGPFDWCTTSWKSVEDSIRTGFEDYLNYQYLSQSKTDPKVYCNEKYGHQHAIYFPHDFVSYLSLKKQLPRVKEKYSRRIRNFYDDIKEPTLFIRWVRNDWDAQEIVERFDDIVKWIKGYNSENEIIFITENQQLISCGGNRVLYLNENTDSNRNHPLYAIKELKEYLINVRFNRREDNLKWFEGRQKEASNFLKNKRVIKLMPFFHLTYRHNKQY